MAGKFVLKKNARGKYHFVLKAGNGEIIAQSETYNSNAAARRTSATGPTPLMFVRSGQAPHDKQLVSDSGLWPGLQPSSRRLKKAHRSGDKTSDGAILGLSLNRPRRRTRICRRRWSFPASPSATGSGRLTRLPVLGIQLSSSLAA